MIKDAQDIRGIPAMQDKNWADCYSIDKDDFNQLCALAIRLLEERRPEVVAPDRDAIIRECRRVVLAVSDDAQEAAKAKDATDYVAGYQDAVVDCDEELRTLLSPLVATGVKK